jgi:hypothetical protein
VNTPTRAVVRVIGFYRSAIGPIRPPACRFSPSCSAYAVEALERFGLARGTWLTLRRLLRCHPFHAGGHDPVPTLVHRRDRPRMTEGVPDARPAA